MTTREQVPFELGTRLDELQATITALEKQIGRAGREQFKANTFAETQATRLATMLELVQTAETRREAELEAARAQTQTAVTEARLAVARTLFPTLDGLDQAIRAGQATLAHSRQREPAAALLRRLLLGGSDEITTLHAALAAWLEGLVMVRRRLLDALAAEGVTPISAEGCPFDPHRHVAVEVVTAAAAPPGTVVQEIRRGFVAGSRILRHAEVAVTVAT